MDTIQNNLNIKSLARKLTIVENDLHGSKEILRSLKPSDTIVIGITGPPGAGKSTLVNCIIKSFLEKDKKIAVLAIDPTSPFNLGSLLGDRIRMNEHFNNPNVFIRSLATRGSLGGLSVKTIEITDVLKDAGFDYILIETVGVGQSEVEIAGLADMTMVVLVPEAGDEIQSIKSGLMEIADVFVINKADRDDADKFTNTIKKLVKNLHHIVPVFKTVADRNEGTGNLSDYLLSTGKKNNDKKTFLLTEKAWKLIQSKKMSLFNKSSLRQEVIIASQKADFNLYHFVDEILRHS